MTTQRSAMVLYNADYQQCVFVASASSGKTVVTGKIPGNNTFEQDIRAFIEGLDEPPDLDMTQSMRDLFHPPVRWCGTYYYDTDQFYLGKVEDEDTVVLRYLFGAEFVQKLAEENV